MVKLKEQCVLEIFRFFDTNSLQKARFASSLINRLVMTEIPNNFNAQLEMVQFRYSNGLYSCKCLPYRGKAVEDKFEELNKAMQYLQTLIYRTSVRLLNIHYINLDSTTLELFKQLEAGCISDISITGCNFQDTDPQTFYDIFVNGSLKADRYTITRSKSVQKEMFDDRFLTGLMGRNVKMITLEFCSYLDANQRFLPITCDKLLDWFFDKKAKLEYRVFSISDLKLDRDFADRLIETFQTTPQPRPVSMIISGEVEQDAEQTNGKVRFGTGPMPEHRVKHKSAPFYLKFGRVQPDRIEFSIFKWTSRDDGTDAKRARRSNLNDYPPKA